MSRRRVLLVSYHFPPVGGAGVQRPAKFARYLPEFGWDVTVLQASNPSVPLLDPSLLDDLPPGLVTIKARTLEPGYAAKSGTRPAPGARSSGLVTRVRNQVRRLAAMALQPDPQILWYPAAMRAGMAALRDTRHDAILATAPSYSNLLLGARLKSRTGLPFIADFRDEWDISSEHWENAARDSLTRRIQPAMQRRVLRRADAIVATTRASTRRLAGRAADAGAAPIAECIYNGWDPADLPAPDGAVQPAVPRTEPLRFRLVYAGTLWNLTSLEPVAQAIERLGADNPRLAGRLELVLLGRKTPEQLQIIERLSHTPVLVHSVDYVEHQVALATMADADSLLLLLAALPGAERVAPAKLFEYLAVDRPMLAVTPEGETAEIVRTVEADGWRSPDDVAGIVNWLTTRLEGARPSAPAGRASVRDHFQRRQQAGQLSALLDRLAGGTA